MTIRKGEEWGTLRPPAHPVLVERDRDLARAFAAGADADTVFGLTGGDVMRTLGGAADLTRLAGSQPIPHLPVDLVRVVFDDEREDLFVAHLVARHSWWRGRITAAMNAQFIGDWDVAPRSHPNDGRVDVVEVAATLGLQQRWMAKRRVKLGTHVPHPSITIVQRASAVVELDRATPIWLDGERCGSARRIELTVVPDALTVCV